MQTQSNQQLYFTSVLLNDGWADNVLMDIDCNGLIQEIKPNSERPANFAGETISGAVIPGMVNNHSHAFQWAMAGLAEQSGQGSDSFWSWRKTMYDFVGKIAPEDLHAIASALYMQMLKAGYTSVGEFHYLHHDVNGKPFANLSEMSQQISQAALDTGIGLTLLPVFYRYAGFGQQTPNQGQRRFINGQEQYAQLLEAVSKITNQPNQNFGIAPHSLRAVAQQDMQFAIEKLDDLTAQAPIHIHIAEQMPEVNDCLAFYQQRPVEWLTENFKLNARWCLVHATHMNTAEIAAVANAGSVVSICTSTEANLGDGFFPMLDYKKLQGLWSIGSDSHISVDPTEELRWLEYENRLQQQSRTVLTTGEYSSNGHWLWAEAARGGAQSLNKQVGKLSVGMQADFLELKQNSFSLFGKEKHQLLDAFIFNQQAEKLIKNVWVAGKLIVQENQHLQQDKIFQQYQTAMKKLTA